jgi:hypothetical protein
VFLCCLRRLLVTTNVIPNSLILVTLMMEAVRSSETSVLARVTGRNIPEYGILHTRLLTKRQMIVFRRALISVLI